MWVIDEPLPADGGAWFLEVDAHHDVELVDVFVADFGEAFGVLDRSFGVVDGAGANDDEESRVFASEDILNGGSAVNDGVDGTFANWQRGFKLARHDQGFDRLNINVVGFRQCFGGCIHGVVFLASESNES